MNYQANDSQIAEYADQGFAVIRELLDAVMLERWRHAIDRRPLRCHLRQENTHHNQRNDRPDDYYKNVFVQCVNLWKSSEEGEGVGTRREFWPFGGQPGGYFRCATLSRSRHGQAAMGQSDKFPCRQSRRPLPFAPVDYALDRLGRRDTEERLPLLSSGHPQEQHRFDVGGKLSEAGIGELLKKFPEWEGIEPQSAEMKAGDGVFISGMVAHGAGPNMTIRPRRAFAMLYMPEDATFNGKKSALPQEVFERLKAGDLLADDEHLPLVFSQSES